MDLEEKGFITLVRTEQESPAFSQANDTEIPQEINSCSLFDLMPTGRGSQNSSQLKLKKRKNSMIMIKKRNNKLI